MDDVDSECWHGQAHIDRFMQAKGMQTVDQLQAYYSNRTIGNVKQLGLSAIVWQDPFDMLVPVIILLIERDPCINYASSCP